MFVVMLGFYTSFLNLSQLPAAKKDMQKLSTTTNVQFFLFCHGFSTLVTMLFIDLLLTSKYTILHCTQVDENGHFGPPTHLFFSNHETCQTSNFLQSWAQINQGTLYNYVLGRGSKMILKIGCCRVGKGVKNRRKLSDVIYGHSLVKVHVQGVSQ